MNTTYIESEGWGRAGVTVAVAGCGSRGRRDAEEADTNE